MALNLHSVSHRRQVLCMPMYIALQSWVPLHERLRALLQGFSKGIRNIAQRYVKIHAGARPNMHYYPPQIVGFLLGITTSLCHLISKPPFLRLYAHVRGRLPSGLSA